jgi:peptidoglycan/LPS O-acetylase OafA/YrhL
MPAAPLARPRSGYLPTLDGWRAIAVGMVLINHAGLPDVHGLGWISTLGALGVDLFFAISGLLICSRLLEEERVLGRISLGGFYIRRTFRIFPPAYLFLAVIAILTVAHAIPADWPAWSSAVLFVRNYFTTFVRDTAANRFTGHFWSLAVEEHFYLLLPGLLVLFPKHRKRVLAALILVALAWLIFYMANTPPLLRQLYWERRTDFRLNSLLIPALLALLLAEPGNRERIAAVVTPLNVGVLLAALLLAGFGYKKLGAHPQPQPGASVQTAVAAETTPTTEAAPIRNAKDSKLFLATIFVVPVLFPCLILATMLHPGTLVSRLLELRPLRAAGRISYSLYLWQQLFWVPVRYVHWPIGAVERHWVGFPLTVAAALASYYLVEKPVIRLGHWLAPPPTPGHPDLDAPAKEIQ